MRLWQLSSVNTCTFVPEAFMGINSQEAVLCHKILAPCMVSQSDLLESISQTYCIMMAQYACLL